MRIYTLDKVNLLNEVKVHSLSCTGQIRRRLLDLGICEGTSITPIFNSITEDSTAYLVRGAIIALRKEDSKNISIYFDF